MGESEIDAEIARAAFGRASEAALIVGQDRIVIAVNDAACRLLGKPKAELEAKPLAFVPESVWVALSGGDSVKTEIDVPSVASGATTLGVSATANIRPHTHLLLLNDVTERRRREILSERYELLARHTHDIVLFIDRNGCIVEANDAAVNAYGYSRDVLCSLHITDLRDPATHGDIAPRMEEAFRSNVLFETVHRRKDGTTFPVEVGSRSANIAGEMLLLSVIRDITDRQQIQAGLVQADRLATFGMMAAGVAHEINNPLAYSLTNVDVLARRVGALLAKTRAAAAEHQTMNAAELSASLEQCSEMIAIAQEGMGRVRSIVRDLKTFSREDEGAGDLVDVRAVLDSSINVARGEIRQRARVVREYGEVPLVQVDASRLGQVFLNLIVNAAQAIAEGRNDGEMRIVTRTSETGDAIVEVVDNGSGIEERMMGQIFRPFVTTKPRGEGTGLGLHIASTIARACGGDVIAESRVGRGTTMRVRLPAATANASSRPANRRDTSTTQAARILIVDDEEALGITLRALLSPPHHAVSVTRAADALARIDAGECYDVIFCDLMMPEINGMRFHQILSASRPDLAARIVFMTGGIGSPGVQQFLQATGARCLGKPFSHDELLDAIAATLAQQK